MPGKAVCCRAIARPRHVDTGSQERWRRFESARKSILCKQPEIGNTDDAHARIALHGAKGIELLQMSPLNAGFVVQYAFRRIVDRFINPDKAARERPLASERILLSFDEKRCGPALV